MALDEYLKPSVLSKLAFWIGGILGGIAMLFFVLEFARLNAEFYVLQAPFGVLFLVLVVVIMAIGIFILSNIYDLLNQIEDPGSFTPVTKTVILFLIFLIVVSIELIGLMVYYIIRIPALGGT